ncbi:tetratricopeptide repeat protein [Nocardia tengchongensis]|uniref:tetratricopeptide repeat protein n=1 Tax=Nocardia tengchongensis TaxID=2055889 RepID=UPI00367AB8C6
MKYTARVTGRDGRWWAVWIPELGEDAQTQARRLADVEAEARDYVSVTLDIAPSKIEIEVEVDDFGDSRDVQKRSDWILAVRKQIELLESRVQQETKALAVELSSDGMPIRDIATLVGTTFQRVGQLVSENGESSTSYIKIKTSTQSRFPQLAQRYLKDADSWKIVDIAFPSQYVALILGDPDRKDAFARETAHYLLGSLGNGGAESFVQILADEMGKAGSNTPQEGAHSRVIIDGQHRLSHLKVPKSNLPYRHFLTTKFPSRYMSNRWPDLAESDTEELTPQEHSDSIFYAAVTYLSTHEDAVRHVAVHAKQPEDRIIELLSTLRKSVESKELPGARAIFARSDVDTDSPGVNQSTSPYRTSVTPIEEIVPLLEKDLSEAQRILGADHADTLIARNNLANAYKSIGRIDEAVLLYEKNLSASEQILGDRHPFTLSADLALASARPRRDR